MDGSPSALLTLGFGSWGSSGLVLTLGLGVGEAEDPGLDIDPTESRRLPKRAHDIRLPIRPINIRLPNR